MTEYEKCKLECKKQRDQVNTQDYIHQLEEELRQAKELLAQQQQQEQHESSEQEHSGHDEEQPTTPPTTEEEQKPIVEVNIRSSEKHDEI